MGISRAGQMGGKEKNPNSIRDNEQRKKVIGGEF
jgi:hypothetical protein